MKQRNAKSLAHFGTTLWLLGTLVFAAPSVRAQNAAPAPASSSTEPSDADLAATQCLDAEEKFLPADYYYCLGTRSYGERNYASALKFFRTAASWASKPAQYVLGVMALNGDQQPINRPLALAWLTLATERSSSPFQRDHDALYKSSSAEERNKALALLATMRPVYGDATAAVRAERRYRNGVASLKNQDVFCFGGTLTRSDTPACVRAKYLVQTVDKKAGDVFDGWSGHVTVGPLQQVPAPSVSNGK